MSRRRETQEQTISRVAFENLLDSLKNQGDDEVIRHYFTCMLHSFGGHQKGAATEARYCAELAKNKKWFKKFREMGGVDMNTGLP